jgi:lipopolysaccharide/colanic/teichoic acid biosynthesis glycosyltransferase
MAGRPILMGVAGDAAEVIEQAGAGRHFPPENAQELADAVRDFMRMTPEERARIGAAGRKYYEEELSLAVGARRFAEVLERASLLKPTHLALKRLLDISMAGLALALLSLPLAVVALMVRLKLGAPVIFRQVRPGKDGELFTMYKFRTMTEKLDVHGALAPDRDRLTRFGSFLRASSLDELPELWNVLRGHMSLVGPRPLLQRYTEYFTHEETLRLTVKPGITGWAQVNGRNDASWDSRLGMDVWYVRNLSIKLDMRILGRTVASVFRRRGVVVDPESTMQNLDDERRRVIAK